MTTNQKSLQRIPTGRVLSVTLVGQKTRWAYFIKHPLLDSVDSGQVAIKAWIDGSGQTLIIRTDPTCVFSTREDARQIGRDLTAIRNRKKENPSWPANIVFQW